MKQFKVNSQLKQESRNRKDGSGGSKRKAKEKTSSSCLACCGLYRGSDANAMEDGDEQEYYRGNSSAPYAIGYQGAGVNTTSNNAPYLSSRPPCNDNLVVLLNEVEFLKEELNQSCHLLSILKERDMYLTERLSNQAQKEFEMKGESKFENLSLGQNRPSQLGYRYGMLYTQSRLEAYDALDDIQELNDMDALKTKLLLSVVVLSFRSAERVLQLIKNTIRALLDGHVTTSESRRPSRRGLDDQMHCTSQRPLNDRNTSRPYPDDKNISGLLRDIDDSINIYLKKSISEYDVTKIVQDVSEQVFSTLYEYPSLRQCDGLSRYILDSVRLAWAFVVQTPPFVIDHDTWTFDPSRHSRFHSADPESSQIKLYLWPSLHEYQNGPCAYKGIVLT